MSVPVGDRSQREFLVLSSARNLKNYTNTLTHSDKRFPKSVRWETAIPLRTEAREACLHIRRANAAPLSPSEGSSEDFSDRISWQCQTGRYLGRSNQNDKILS